MGDAHGAKILKAFINTFAIKVEDHPSQFEPMPLVNYQWYSYMNRNGVMYLFMEDLEAIDSLGNIVDKDLELLEEGPPRTD